MERGFFDKYITNHMLRLNIAVLYKYSIVYATLELFNSKITSNCAVRVRLFFSASSVRILCASSEIMSGFRLVILLSFAGVTDG
jgi:hypothetical protein